MTTRRLRQRATIRARDLASRRITLSQVEKVIQDETMTWLRPEEKQILKEYFGIGTEEFAAISEIAEKLGFCQQYVRAIKSRSLDRVFDHYRAAALPKGNILARAAIDFFTFERGATSGVGRHAVTRIRNCVKGRTVEDIIDLGAGGILLLENARFGVLEGIRKMLASANLVLTGD